MMKWLLPCVLLAPMSAGIAHADPAADKLFTEAKAAESQAQQLRSQEQNLLQQVGDDELKAQNLDRESTILAAQALKILKADAKKQEAFRLRQEARWLWAEAHNEQVKARNTEANAAQHRHDAGELKKAAGVVKDQPWIAGALEKHAQLHEAAAATDDAEARRLSADAESKDQKAKADWDKAQADDPEITAKTAPPPTRPTVRPAPPPQPSKALAGHH